MQCGFRKGFNTQYSLTAVVEKGRRNLDKGGSGGLLIDLSRAFGIS